MFLIRFKFLIPNLIVMTSGRLTEQRYQKGKEILNTLLSLEGLIGTEHRYTIYDTFRQVIEGLGFGPVADKIIKRYERENPTYRGTFVS